MKHALVLSFSLLFSAAALGGSPASAAGIQLIAGPAVSADASVSQAPGTASRSRLVRLNTGALSDQGAPRAAVAVPEVIFDLFDDAKFTGVVSAVERDGGTTAWRGELKNTSHGYFHIVAVDGAVIAHVASPRGVYEISSAGGGLYRVIELNPRKNGEDFPAKLAEGPAPVMTTRDAAPAGGAGARIDVAVFYTSTARAAEGSTAAMRARIALAVSETNDAYANSGVTTRLRLVHTEEVSYTETGDMETDLARFRTPRDGYMDQVQSVRNAFGADMSSLIVENGGAYCGLASAIMASSNNAYDVTARSCATGYYSFGHEFGHLQGARHDNYVDPKTSPFAYGHGYTHPSVNAPDSWRTVMAYNNACADSGYDCTRLQYFSNPGRSYRSTAMGVAGVSQNFRVLNETGGTVAGFKPTVIGDPFTSEFNGSATGWTPASGRWLTGASSYATVGAVNATSSIYHSGKYGDLVFSARLRRAGCATCSSGLMIRGNPAHLNDGKDWLPGYQFLYSNTGYCSVFKLDETGNVIELMPWTVSAAVVKGGWNTLKVKAVGNVFNFYVNDVAIWQGSDSSAPLAVGSVGIKMYRNDVSTGNKLFVDRASLFNAPASGDVPGGDRAIAPAASVGGANPSMAP